NLELHSQPSLSSHLCLCSKPSEYYTLSLHDALPIYPADCPIQQSITDSPGEWTNLCQCYSTWRGARLQPERGPAASQWSLSAARSEEHTSELQSRENLVCRLLLEKKKHLIIALALRS